MKVAIPTASIVPQLLTPRQAAQRTRVAWATLRAELERAGYRILRIAGRERVRSEDLAALLAAGEQPTAAETATRADAVLAQVLEERGITKRARRRRGA